MSWEALFIAYALKFIGIPYRYGGQSPLEGLDCSGYARVVLRSQGIVFDNLHSAATLYEYFSLPENHENVPPQCGSLVFYGSDTRHIDHVALLVSPTQHVEAGGGGPNVVTLQQAISAHAFIRLTPLRDQHRVAILMPNYPYRPLP